MGLLVFTDDESFDTDGPLRAEKRSDGWYVIGEGYLIPVDEEAEAERLIREMQEKEKDEKPTERFLANDPINW
jgi:hypothetical protein